MRRLAARLLAACALLALVAAPAAEAAWTQAQGDAHRNGVVVLPGGPLDVVAIERLDASVYTFGAAAGVPVQDGILVAAFRDQFCEIVVMAEPLRSLALWERCAWVHFIATDPDRGVAFVSRYLFETGPEVVALDLVDGSILWSHTWSGFSALGGAFDRASDRLYLPVTYFDHTVDTRTQGDPLPALYADATFRARLDALDAATGEVVFEAPIPATMASDEPVWSAWGAQSASQQARGVTVTETGLLLTGFFSAHPTRIAGGQVLYQEMFVAWFTSEGAFRGLEHASLGKEQDTGAASSGFSRAGTQWPVARGALAALAIGDEAIVIQPASRGIVLRAPLTAVEPTTAGVFWRGGAWNDDALILQLSFSLRAFEPATLAPSWTWTESLGHYLHDVMRVAGGRLVVLAASTEEALLVELDAEKGTPRTRLRLPIDLHAEGEDGVTAALVPAEGDTLHVVTDRGTIVSLARADESLRPLVDVSNAYPAPGERVQLAATPGVEGGRLEVDWGDARPEPLGPEGAQRVLSERGVIDVRVIAHYPDGRTATTLVPFDVGGTPPPELSFVQKAFAPDNQDMTFGILGVGLTILGAAFTIGRTRARIGRLERELGIVEEMRIVATDRPREAVVSLRKYREALPHELARGRMNDSQFHVLDMRSARLMRVLKARLLAPYDDRFSDRFRRLLDQAFEDAMFGPAEYHALCDALSRETLITEPERDIVRGVLADLTAFGGIEREPVRRLDVKDGSRLSKRVP